MSAQIYAFRQPSLVYGTVDVWQNIDLQRWALYFISSAGFRDQLFLLRPRLSVVGCQDGLGEQE